MLYLPKHSRQRFFKFKLDNSWKTLRINNPNHLKKLLLKYYPSDVYYSVASYLDGIKAEKGGSRFISGDLAIDFDNVDIMEVLRVTNFMDAHYGFRLKYCIETRKDHYQLLYKIPSYYYDTIKNSRRMGYNLFIRDVYDTLERQGFNIDYKLRKRHSNRVIRLPLCNRRLEDGTIEKINFIHIPKQFRLGLGRDGLESIFSGKEAFVTSFFNPNRMTQFNTRKNKSEARHLPRSSSEVYHRMYASSCILGTKDRHIIPLKFAKLSLRKAIKVVNRFNLGESYLFKDKEYFWLISCKSIPRKRLSKILIKTKSSAKREVNKFRQRFFPIYGKDDNEDKLEFICKIGKPDRSHYSGYHLKLLKKMGASIELEDYTLSGKGISLVNAEFSRPDD